jgi:uncharacterized protein involved in response to NO
MSVKKIALFELGFRPFYLLAALWSIWVIVQWVLELNGIPSRFNEDISSMQWHAHEMIFGFATTVICGFALTAVKAWTGLDTPRDYTLGGLTALWLIGKIGVIFSSIFIVAEILFLPAIAIITAKLILDKKQYRNLFLPLVLTLLANLNIFFYLAIFNRISFDPNSILIASLYLILVIEFIIGGRVIPSFTANALLGLKQYRSPLLARVTLISSIVALITQLMFESGYLSSALCLIAAILQLRLLIGWNPFATRHKPILWILHASYSWIFVGFILLGIHSLGLISIYPAIHAFGIGLTGGLIIGMITRTALGHTGRELKAGKIEISAYALVQATTLLWLLSHLINDAMIQLLTLAGTTWVLAFALYTYKYIPYLVSPRFDGKPG